MDFDFQALYATYSTRELLQITAAPKQYQASAVKAAEDILATRSPADIKEAESNLRAAKSRPRTTQPRSNFHESIFDEDEPAERPALLRRYRIIITIAIGIMVGFALYQQGMTLWYLHDPFVLFSDIHTATSTVVDLGSIVAIIFFIQKKQAGWILMAGVVTFYALTFLLAVLAYVYYGNFGRLFYTVLLLMLYAGVAYLLWMPGIKKLYKVDDQTAIRTVIVSATVTAGYCIWITIGMWLGR